FALDLDQVRHLHHFVDVAEDLADALLLGADRRADRLAGSLGCLVRHGGDASSLCCAGEPRREFVPCAVGSVRRQKRRRHTKSLPGPELQHCFGVLERKARRFHSWKAPAHGPALLEAVERRAPDREPARACQTTGARNIRTYRLSILSIDDKPSAPY